MFQKKNVLVGLAGFILTVLTVVFILESGTFTKGLQLLSVCLGLSLALFFIGFAVGGFYAGAPAALYTAVFFGIMAAPASIRGLLFLLFIGALCLGPKLFALLRKKNAPADEDMDVEEEREWQEAKKAFFKRAVYLIKPNKFKNDVTYKVVDKDGFIYFCKCGGQFYDIDPEIAMDANLSEKGLLSDKKSFRVKKDEIQRVEINSKTRYWTGNIRNNGSLNMIAGKKMGFIIHGINNIPQVQTFFTTALPCPVSVCIDPKQKQAEENAAAFKKQSGEEQKRVKDTTGALNTVAMISTLWLMIYPRPRPLAVGVGLIIPIIALVYYLSHGPYVTFDVDTRKPEPNIFTAFTMPASGLTVFSLLAYNLIYGWRVWCSLILLALMLSAIALGRRKEHRVKKSLIILIPTCAYIYFFGAVTATNCLFDYHEPESYTVAAVDKIQYSTGPLQYTLEVDGWPVGRETLKPNVSGSKYNAVEIGGLVRLNIRSGLWGIRWYTVVPWPKARA